MTADTAPEFWEANFSEKKEMWGFEPAPSALLTRNFFVEQGLKNILIPGFGYGRNAQIFREAGMNITGIEISETAIKLARKHYGEDMIIYHGSVTDMPFDDNKYEGIFCYALIHLLDSHERQQLIQNCYRQLADGGYMIFVAISKEAPTYGTGNKIEKDRYEIFKGVNMYFYDRESIQEAFGGAGLVEVTTIKEKFPFFIIKCQKAS